MALFLVIILTNLAMSDERDRQREFARLFIERSQLQEKLAQKPPQQTVVALQGRIKEINRKIRSMGINLPESPEPPLSEFDRTDLSIPRMPVLLFSDKRYNVDLHMSHAFNNNYFQAVAGAPRQSVWLTNFSTSLNVTISQSYDQQFTAGVNLQRNFLQGIENADWSVFGANLRYAYKTHQFTFHGLFLPQKLNFVTQDAASGISRTSGFGADYANRPNPNMRLRAFYRLNDIRYPEFSNRNVKIHFASGDIQYRLHNLFMPGIGFEYSNTMAKTDNYVYREMTPVLLLGARFGRIASVNLRYRYKMRDYTISDSQSGNFGRRDFRHDAYMYAGIGLGRYLYLIAFGSYMKNSSSRAYRSFSAMSGGATLQFQFPR